MSNYDESRGGYIDYSGGIHSNEGLVREANERLMGGQSSGGAGTELLGELFGGSKKKRTTSTAPVITGQSYEEVMKIVDKAVNIASDENFRGYPLVIDEVLNQLEYPNMGWSRIKSNYETKGRKSPIDNEKDLVLLKRRLVEQKAKTYIRQANERNPQEKYYDDHIFSDYCHAFVTDPGNKKIAAAFTGKLSELEKRAETGDRKAISALMWVYKVEGIDPKAYPHPLEIVKLQAEAGNATAEVCLAELYEHGLAGLPKNRHTAKQWLKKAAQHGNKAAKKRLNESRFTLGWKASSLLILVILAGITVGAIKLFPTANQVGTEFYLLLAVLAVVLIASIVSIARKRYLLIVLFLLVSIGGAYIFFTGKGSPRATPATEEVQ